MSGSARSRSDSEYDSDSSDDSCSGRVKEQSPRIRQLFARCRALQGADVYKEHQQARQVELKKIIDSDENIAEREHLREMWTTEKEAAEKAREAIAAAEEAKRKTNDFIEASAKKNVLHKGGKTKRKNRKIRKSIRKRKSIQRRR